jgi:transcriptional regulator with XRE-family HTH domain
MALTTMQLAVLREATHSRVRLARQLCNLTQVELAEALDVSQSFVSDIERGRFNSITVENARKLADFFGVAIEDLFPARQEVA